MFTHGDLSRTTCAGLTDLQLRNAELEAEVAQLRQALRRTEATARRSAVGAHDIRNALTVILAETDLLASSLREPDQQESIRALASATRIVASIAQEILVQARKAEWRKSVPREPPAPEAASPREQQAADATLSKAVPTEAVPTEASPIVVNIGELMKACQKLIERMLERSVKCVFAADAPLWPVTVQPERFEAALLNLVSNARDAMPAGGKAAIRARNIAPDDVPPATALPPGQYVGFSVEDTGIGMPRDVLAKATEAFFTTKPKERGTGLGLAMVHAFATEAGGALHIESEVGRGTRVEVLLPRACSRPQPLDAADSRCAVLQRIRQRVRTQWLLEVLDAWNQVSEPGGLPRPAQLEAALLDHAECSLVLAVDLVTEPIQLRLVRLGQALVERLEQAAIEQVDLGGAELFGNLATTYRQALRSRSPNYQFARYRLGPGSDTQFERLVLPAATDAQTASHLFGVVLISSTDIIERGKES
jgi:signal transduction histidine kinase